MEGRSKARKPSTASATQASEETINLCDDEEDQLIDISDEPATQEEDAQGVAGGGGAGAAAAGAGRAWSERPSASQQEERYAMDNCPCSRPLDDMRSQLTAALEAVPGAQHLISPPASTGAGAVAAAGLPHAPALLSACGCPACGAPLSHRDVRSLLGAGAMHRVYQVVAAYLMHKDSASPIATMGTPQCADCNSRPMVRTAQVVTQGGGAAASGGGGDAADEARSKLLTRAVLKEALSARGLPVTGNIGALAARLGGALTASGAQWACTACAAVVAAPCAPTPPPPSMRRSDVVGSPASLVAALRVHLTDTSRGGGGGGTNSRATTKKATPAKKGGKGAAAASTWVKGTGYGGPAGDDKAANAGREKAEKRQATTDGACVRALGKLADCLRGGGGGGGRGGGGGERAISLPEAALLMDSELPYLLRILLQNDSLQDIGQRQELYRSLISLLKLLGSSMDTVEVFVVPTDDPDDIAREAAAAAAKASAGASGAGASAPSTSTGHNHSLFAVLQRLNTQCTVYKRSGQELGQGDDEDLGALSIALELSSLYEDISEAVGMWRSTVASADAAAAGAGTSAAATPGRGRGGGRLTAEQKAQQAAKAQSAYLGAMQPLLFQEKPLIAGHYFRSQLGGKAAGGEVMRKRLKRITEEISTLSTSLPLNWESAILVAVDSDRIDVLRALILPSPDTPYAHGPFVFDILFPQDYPQKPPSVQFLTTGGGTVRFNPNLYNCGKVCLSLLGTWSGPSWQPGTSTLLQVLLSISAMIIVPDPFFNEPSYERMMSTPQGKAQSKAYNEGIRCYTLHTAVMPAAQAAAGVKPGTGLPGWDTFKEAITAYYRAKRADIERTCDAWVAESTSVPHKKSMESTTANIKHALTRLAP
ncbi:hypothetical protein FOA52_002411 [Chlamydomonas sp. UWO 241]|nr:hypothetical protein FOA52_002411 [Chlamydomonas sp. UWO 241]